MDLVAIDSQRSDLRAVPSKACFSNTSTNHFCCINVWGPGTTHCSQACQNRKSISVLGGAYLTFFQKYNRPIFQTFQNRRNSGSRYFKSSRTARFHQRTSGYLTYANGSPTQSKGIYLIKHIFLIQEQGGHFVSP
jgi:hypothetical protein